MILRHTVFGLLVVCLPHMVVADPVAEFFETRGPLATTSDLSTGPLNNFSLFRPQNPGQDGARHPVITWGNGTFAVPQFYFGFLDHLASHGYVVIASNDLFTGSGQSMLEGVDWIIEQNSDPASPLFGAVDIDAIGATGHSQGGGGAINAGNDPRIDCTAPIEPIFANVEGLQGPTFITAGELDTIVPARRIFLGNVRHATVPTVFGILDGATHFEALGDAGGFRGYVTAWFASCLADDQFARTAFYGDCSLCENDSWRVRRKNWE